MNHEQLDRYDKYLPRLDITGKRLYRNYPLFVVYIPHTYNLEQKDKHQRLSLLLHMP